MTAARCAYRFDPEAWSREHDRPSTVRDAWSCPHDAVEGRDRCQFHLSPAERREEGIASDVVGRTLRGETAAATSSMRFIGATLETVDLSTTVIDRETNDPLDLRHVSVRGDVDLVGATIRQPVLLEATTVSGGIDCSDAAFSHPVRCAGVSVSGESRFENATFENLVDFTTAEFRDRVSFADATFERDVEFYRLQANGDARFQNTEWRMGCRFHLATFAGRADFYSSRFAGRSDFRSASFDGVARFSKSVFEGDVLFLEATFDREALFKKIAFGSNVHFQNASFDTEASFSETTFGGKTKFQFATFRGEASISYATFDGNAYFHHVRFGDYAEFFECRFEGLADFRWAEFHDVGRFMDARFDVEGYFDRSRFLDVADFRDARFEHIASFHATAFARSPMFQRAEIETIDFVDLASDVSELTVDLEAAHVRRGRIRQTNGVECFYNLREAVIGDVAFDVDADGRLFDTLLIARTTFDGFDFSRYHYALSPEWNLHRFSGRMDIDYDTEASRFQLGEPSEPEMRTGDAGDSADTDRSDDRPVVSGGALSGDGSTPGRSLAAAFARVSGALRRGPDSIADAPDRETTYLKAKNGANEVGDSRAASAFFVREMYFRRYAHLKRALDRTEAYRTRARSSALATMNWLLSMSCGYGEKPYRTLTFSVFVVLSYAVVYSLVLDAPPSGSAFGYVLFSFQSFTALVLGVDTDTLDFTTSLVAASQGFVGAFLIGLFVFTLTRSIHR